MLVRSSAGIEITFKDGKVVDFSAEQGEDVLAKLLDTDEGARRLGEVALVPDPSPISQSGIIFFNTLFDENAFEPFSLRVCLCLQCERRYRNVRRRISRSWFE